jgi:hypothetical protein
MNPATSREPWLTKAELAAEFKVSIRTIERLGLPATRIGGQNRYQLSEVERFLKVPSPSATVIRLADHR